MIYMGVAPLVLITRRGSAAARVRVEVIIRLSGSFRASFSDEFSRILFLHPN